MKAIPRDTLMVCKISTRIRRAASREGRNAVQRLRLYDQEAEELDQALSRIAEELSMREGVLFCVNVAGAHRSLHPVVRDELYRIGREAIINAFRHSGGMRIEVELAYTKDSLRLLIRDDGHGINPQILRSGREGHWGLVGMRERAARIDAHVLIRSSADRGTEIDLCVPARSAFSRQSPAI
jgi:signal transduction histidine kinase